MYLSSTFFALPLSLSLSSAGFPFPILDLPTPTDTRCLSSTRLEIHLLLFAMLLHRHRLLEGCPITAPRCGAPGKKKNGFASSTQEDQILRKKSKPPPFYKCILRRRTIATKFLPPYWLCSWSKKETVQILLQGKFVNAQSPAPGCSDTSPGVTHRRRCPANDLTFCFKDTISAYHGRLGLHLRLRPRRVCRSVFWIKPH